jgi:hypothetical protein
MVTLTIVAGALLTVFVLIKKRQLEARGGKRFSYHLFDKSLEFLIPFSIIGLLFLLLSLFVEDASDKTTMGNLMSLEKLIGFFKGFVSRFKVGTLATVGLLTIFYLLNLTRIPSKYTSRLIPFLKKYQKVVKLAYMIVIILFSFTFFGTQAGAPEARLRFRIRENEGKYGELRQEVNEALSQEVAKKLLEKIESSSEPEYRKDLDEQNHYYAYFISLRSQYEGFKYKYEQRDAGAENVINRPPADDPPPPGPRPSGGNRGNQNPHGSETGPSTEQSTSESTTGERIVYEVFEGGEPIPPAVEPLASEVSAEKINQAKASVRAFRERFKGATVGILTSEHGRELAVLLPKTFSGKVKEAVFKALTDRYPILEPIVGAFVGAINKDLETRTLKAANSLANSLAQNPSDASQKLEQEASRIAEETKFSFSDVLMSRASGIGGVLRRRGQNIREILDRLNTRKQQIDEITARAEKADQYIEDLSCHSPQLRLTAARELSKTGRELKPEQVKRIEELLNANGEGLRRSTAYQNRYEVVPLRYYAALAMREMQSPYLTEGVNETAAEIIRDVDSVPVRSRIYYEKEFVEDNRLTAP